MFLCIEPKGGYTHIIAKPDQDIFLVFGSESVGINIQTAWSLDGTRFVDWGGGGGLQKTLLDT